MGETVALHHTWPHTEFASPTKWWKQFLMERYWKFLNHPHWVTRIVVFGWVSILKYIRIAYVNASFETRLRRLRIERFHSSNSGTALWACFAEPTPWATNSCLWRVRSVHEKRYVDALFENLSGKKCLLSMVVYTCTHYIFHELQTW